LESIGKAMKNMSGGEIVKEESGYAIDEYVFGDISSTIYPVNGGLEDWAYGAGWDFDS